VDGVAAQKLHGIAGGQAFRQLQVVFGR
jgi:hypothetical protein